MTKFVSFLVALIAIVCCSSASAFTVVPKQTTSTLSRAVEPKIVSQTMPVTTRGKPLPMFVDWGVSFSSESAIGSIGMLVALVSIWELVTPGRAKKA
jgi:hypothetical protein